MADSVLQKKKFQNNSSNILYKGVPSAESSRSVRGLGKGVSGKPYSRLCNVRRPRLEPGTFRSQAVRLYRLHQARPSASMQKLKHIFASGLTGTCGRFFMWAAGD